MKPEPPAHRRKFADASEEMGYLYDKLVYWLYERQDRRRARPYAGRLERLLSKSRPQTKSAGSKVSDHPIAFAASPEGLDVAAGCRRIGRKR